MKLTLTQILDFPKRYRANLINSLSGVKTPVLVGTKNQANATNLSIFNSLLHIGAHPPLLGILCRPNNTPRHTLNNILETGHYTLNFIPQNLIERAHQTSAKYPASISEFEACHIEPLWTDFNAPYVKESPIRIGMEFKEQLDIKINGTLLIIGEIKEVYIEDSKIDEEGNALMTAHDISSIVGLNAYHVAKRLYKLSYAEPDEKLIKTE